MAIFNRFPKWSQIAPVYALIVLIIYSWTLLWFFWKFPSWLYFLSIPEILSALAYSIVTNFLESLAVLVLPLVISFLLPVKWFRDVFVARAGTLVILGLGCMMYLASLFQTKDDYPSQVINLAPFAGIAILLLVFLAGKFNLPRKALEFLADRAVVLLYISIPASILSLLFIVVRMAL